MKSDLCRLARFGSNITEAHSCFVFLPAQFLDAMAGSQEPAFTPADPFLKLAGYYSLTREIQESARLSGESGLIGWVAKHHRPIHVSPFDRDARTLGVYTVDQQLKSFMAIPVPLAFLPGQTQVGVLACDSKKAYAFSKLQGKLLEDLGLEVAQTLRMRWELRKASGTAQSWDSFAGQAQELLDALGASSIDVIRVRVSNASLLETRLGSPRFVEMLDLFVRLVGQALPPGAPLYRLPHGDIVLVLDNMMAAFVQNKIGAIANHISPREAKLELDFIKRSCASAKREGLSGLLHLVTDTARGDSSNEKGLKYEYRRA